MKNMSRDEGLGDLKGDRVLPLFPLDGVVLLPGNFLPLNVFEQRYRNLVEDALAGERRIGMVQPRRGDGGSSAAGEDAGPRLYTVGCAGRIARCERQPDGHYEMKAFAVDEERNAVVAAAVFHGSNTAEGGPTAPTGRTVAADYVYVMTFDDGKIRHMTKIWNDVQSLRALGWA